MLLSPIYKGRFVPIWIELLLNQSLKFASGPSTLRLVAYVPNNCRDDRDCDEYGTQRVAGEFHGNGVGNSPSDCSASSSVFRSSSSRLTSMCGPLGRSWVITSWASLSLPLA